MFDLNGWYISVTLLVLDRRHRSCYDFIVIYLDLLCNSYTCWPINRIPIVQNFEDFFFTDILKIIRKKRYILNYLLFRIREQNRFI